MSIERVGGQFVPVCDYCGCELPPCNTYVSALISMRREEWTRRRRDYENIETGSHYEDICPECQELENERR